MNPDQIQEFVQNHTPQEIYNTAASLIKTLGNNEKATFVNDLYWVVLQNVVYPSQYALAEETKLDATAVDATKIHIGKMHENYGPCKICKLVGHGAGHCWFNSQLWSHTKEAKDGSNLVHHMMKKLARNHAKLEYQKAELELCQQAELLLLQ